MTPRVGRFAVALGAFVVWLGWLVYLAVTWSRPTVLSQPQFLVADCTVLVAINEAPGELTEVKVLESYGPRVGDAVNRPPPTPERTIPITNLSTAIVWDADPKERVRWRRPGTYVLPLILNADGQSYRVAPLPPSPGHSFPGTPRIYPLDDTTRRQLPTHVGPKVEG